MAKYAQLDERGVFVGMVEAETPPKNCLAQITECDLAPHHYRWQPDDGPLGGAFLPLPREQRTRAGAPSLEVALAFTLLTLNNEGRAPDVALAWLDGVVKSVDFASYLKAPLVSDYIKSRGLTVEKGQA